MSRISGPTGSTCRARRAIGLVVTITVGWMLPRDGARSGTLIVDPSGAGDHFTIQAAIDAAVDGDVVTVVSGTYLETIDFLGKDIVVESLEGPETTTIDANFEDTAVRIVSGERRSAELVGFTVTRGRPVRGDAGGISIDDSSPTIRGNIVVGNIGCAGYGISVSFGSPLIIGNVVRGNERAGCSGGIGGAGVAVGGASSAEIIGNVIENNTIQSADGGGISLFAAGTPTILDNIIRGNAVSNGDGGGLSLVNRSDALIIGNLITGNRADRGGGIHWGVPDGARGPVLINNTIVDNEARGIGASGIHAGGFDAGAELINNILVGKGDQPALFCDSLRDRNTPLLRANAIYNPGGNALGGICDDVIGQEGNVSIDPGFVDPAGGDYRLSPDSPLVDAGVQVEVAELDLDGNPRVCGEAIDLGAFETRCVVETFSRGDSNLDGELDVSDPVHSLRVLFLGLGVLPCLDAADADDSGTTDLEDAIFTFDHIFMGGVVLPPPASPGCGVDPTDDDLGCGEPLACR